MSGPDDHFDVDRALGRLARRVGWLRWGVLGGLALCTGLGWLVADHVSLIASDPLHPVVASVDIPVPTLNASGTMDRDLSATERALAVLGAIMFMVIVGAYRYTEGTRRYVVLWCGAGTIALVLLAQWATSGDQRANRDIERLAKAGAYRELSARAKARPQMPYAHYIGAQALLLAGDKEQLRADYGDWLKRWGDQAVRSGYVGARRVSPGVPEWEGSHASAQVMRALELAAFGNDVTPYARTYLRDNLARLAHARQQLLWLVPTLSLAGLATAGVLVTWRRARRNLRQAEQWVVRFDYYQAAPPLPGSPAALEAAAPASLPPIEFKAENPVVR